MRGVAKVIGWVWVLFISVAVVYQFFETRPAMWLINLFVYAILGAPGVVLIFWGREAAGKSTDKEDEGE